VIRYRLDYNDLPSRHWTIVAVHPDGRERAVRQYRHEASAQRALNYLTIMIEAEESADAA
jgi:hypothetical protein